MGAVLQRFANTNNGLICGPRACNANDDAGNAWWNIGASLIQLFFGISTKAAERPTPQADETPLNRHYWDMTRENDAEQGRTRNRSRPCSVGDRIKNLKNAK